MLPFRFFVKITVFSTKPSFFLSPKAINWTFWEVFLFQSHLTANATFSDFQKIEDFFRKTNLFSEKQPEFSYCFENSHLFSLILQHICYLYCFLKQNTFFSKNPYFLTKKNQILNALWNWNFSVAFYCNLLVSAVFKNKQIRFRKTTCFFQEKPNFRKFWEFLLIQSHFTTILMLLSNFC